MEQSESTVCIEAASPWLVAVEDTGWSDRLCGLLRGRDHDVEQVTHEKAALEACTRHESALVLVVGHRGELLKLAALLDAIAEVNAAARVVVVVEPDDVAGASVAMRHGGIPYPARMKTASPPRNDDEDETLRMVGDLCAVAHPQLPVDEDAAVGIAQRALESVADGEVVDAIVALCQIDQPGPATAAAEYLTATAAALLGRVAARCRYPISIDHLMTRLEVPTEADVGLCLELFQRAAFRSAGFHLDMEDPMLRLGPRGVLFGTFHSTAALLRFTGERWWRSPRSIVDELEPLSGTFSDA